MNYYNEFDPKTAAWLRELIAAGLIPKGEVDERSITDVQPGDLRGFVQCHFFAGIGGWSLALKLAGWPESLSIWTGSCPCQPLSCAGKKLGHADERHLWPAFYRLISERRPSICFGEQVAGALGKEWVSAVGSDFGGIGYAFGAADMPAGCFKVPHYRSRFYWVASDPNSVQGHVEVWRVARQAEECADLRSEGSVFWEAEPKPMALADGIPERMASLRGYGNAIVPQVASEFIKAAVEAIDQLTTNP